MKEMVVEIEKKYGKTEIVKIREHAKAFKIWTEGADTLTREYVITANDDGTLNMREVK